MAEIVAEMAEVKPKTAEMTAETVGMALDVFDFMETAEKIDAKLP